MTEAPHGGRQGLTDTTYTRSILLLAAFLVTSRAPEMTEGLCDAALCLFTVVQGLVQTC